MLIVALSALWILVALPVVVAMLVLVAVTMGVVGQRRWLAGLARRCCERCGTVLGRAAVRAADADRHLALAKLHAQRRGLLRRIVGPALRVRCPGCGAVTEFPP
jgi:hypothetical protein